MYDFDIDRHCLPTSGTLHTLNGKHQQEYFIRFGYAHSVLNYVYNDNQMGNGIAFSSNEPESRKRALAFLQAVPFDEKVAATHYKGAAGFYVLVKLPVYPHRPDMVVTTLLFIGANGSLYQHYDANLMKTDDEVFAEFARLRYEAERPAREAAEKARLHQEMMMSGAM